MKTVEKNRKDMVNYLRTSSKHAFMRGEKETFKIEEVSEGVFNEVYNGKRSANNINIEYWLKEYVGGAKNVIKNKIFYDGHGYKSITRKYYEKLLAMNV
jgi:hypothetical protein